MSTVKAKYLYLYFESGSRAATTGNIEIIAASQAKQVKIVVMGAEETGKTGKTLKFQKPLRALWTRMDSVDCSGRQTHILELGE